MRYLTLFVFVCLMSGCSWWPFSAEKTGNCLDDDSCESSNPFEEKLIGGTWYCYGVSRDENWDCSQDEDGAKIADMGPEVVPAVTPDLAEADEAQHRAEMSLESELISNAIEAAVTQADKSESTETEPAAARVATAKNDLFAFSDNAWAVQLIALETMQEITAFAANHEIEEPHHVQIRSQGSDWYILILGIYEDRADADEAAMSWSETNEPMSRPWVRPLGPLKQAALEAEASGS